MRRVALPLLILAPVALANAQTQPSVELVRRPVVVDNDAARTTCTVIPHRELYLDPPVSQSCKVVEFDTLGAAGDKRWSFAVQRHTSVYNFDDSAAVAKRDTVLETETVLFSTSDSRRLVAVLHGREDQKLIRTITPEIADRSGGAALLAVRFCVNGTAGCWQEFWRYDRERWSPVADPLAALRPRVVEAFHGDSTHQTRSPSIDVKTLRGTAQIAAAGDSNCCSSHRAEFQLALDGSRFRVISFRVVANER